MQGTIYGVTAVGDTWWGGRLKNGFLMKNDGLNNNNNNNNNHHNNNNKKYKYKYKYKLGNLKVWLKIVKV